MKTELTVSIDEKRLVDDANAAARKAATEVIQKHFDSWNRGAGFVAIRNRVETYTAGPEFAALIDEQIKKIAEAGIERNMNILLNKAFKRKLAEALTARDDEALELITRISKRFTS